jgi:hypothetical protein
MKVAKPEPRCFQQRGSLPPSTATIHCSVMLPSGSTVLKVSPLLM